MPFEPILMGALFRNYKKLLKLCKEEDNVTEDSIKQKLVLLERQNSFTKASFDKTCERWHGLLYALHKDDNEHLPRKLADSCNSLKEGAAKAEMGGKIFTVFFWMGVPLIAFIALLAISKIGKEAKIPWRCEDSFTTGKKKYETI